MAKDINRIKVVLAVSYTHLRAHETVNGLQKLCKKTLLLFQNGVQTFHNHQ